MGFRTHEEEGAFDGISFDEYLIDNKEATFLMRAKGGAMERAGILDGDLMVVDKSKEPKRTDIVIAAVDGTFRMGYLHTFPQRELKVEAVVTAIVRKYSP